MGNHDRSVVQTHTDTPEARLVIFDDDISINLTKRNSGGAPTSRNVQGLSAEELNRVFSVGEGLIEVVRNLPTELKSLMGFTFQGCDGHDVNASHRTTKLFVALNDTRQEADGTESTLKEIILEIEIPTAANVASS